jgi:hypothetical protein
VPLCPREPSEGYVDGGKVDNAVDIGSADYFVDTRYHVL